MFIMSLAIADLTVGAIVMPISSAYAITGKKLLRLLTVVETPAIFVAIILFWEKAAWVY